MKKYFLLFAVGLLACAGSPKKSVLAEADDITSGSFGDYGAAFSDGVGTPLIFDSDTSKNRSDDKKPKPFFHKIDTSLNGKTIPTFKSDGVFNFSRAPHKIFDEHKAQQFDVRVTITFPRMTLQQAAELEARVRKLFPEAQEIDFGLEKKIEVPAGSFYYDMPDGVEFRILPGTLPRVYNTLPFNPDRILEADSTNVPAVYNF